MLGRYDQQRSLALVQGTRDMSSKCSLARCSTQELGKIHQTRRKKISPGDEIQGIINVGFLHFESTAGASAFFKARRSSSEYQTRVRYSLLDLLALKKALAPAVDSK